MERLQPVKPSFLGARAFQNFDLATLVPYIDWTPFFQTWELAGRYPQILTDNKVGAEAKKLFDDAQALLKRIVAEKWVTASGVVGFWPANSVGDDIALYQDDIRKSQIATLYTLRQQIARDPSATAPTPRLPISSRRKRRGLQIISVASRSRPASARTKPSNATSRRRTTTIAS